MSAAERVALDLTGKVALVTGGASGIGLATAERLVDAGASVVIADLDDGAGERAAKETGATYVRADVSDADAWSSLVTTCRNEFGGIDVAHLNAGVVTGEADIAALTDAQYRRITGANVDGVVFGVRAIAPEMAARGGGAIVATASLAGLISLPLDPIYTMTKHAVIGLVRAVAPQLQARRITINAICPGFVDTPLLGEGNVDTLRRMGIPLIDPAEIAEVVAATIASGETGNAWVCRPGRAPERHTFVDPDLGLGGAFG